MCYSRQGQSKTVYAATARPSRLPFNFQSLNSVTCDELLDWWVSEARRHGVAPQKVVSWIRRKMGGRISIVRYRSDGTLGCSVPCVLCQRELKRYDLHVYCTIGGGDFFSGRLTEEGAPAAALTAGQRRMWKRDKQ